MKHLIMGTAGHVDHGKTTLIRALTGFDCDTHQEEKRRGITINLGFTHLDLDNGESLGIIDVPGHKNFIHTMVGGAVGIDFALLVVAADSSVMPQTREHIGIMDILGIRTGIIAITKADLVEPEMLEIVQEDIKALVKDTFLQECRVIAVSSTTGTGLPELVAAIKNVTTQIPDREIGTIFRMYIDRIFSISGFGTVCTGSVMGGAIKTGDKVYLLPGEKELRVRRLEHHGQETQSIQAGERASINLAGLEKADFHSGMLISDQPLQTTLIVDAKIKTFGTAKPLKLWSQTIFHCGTFQCQAKVHLLDKDKLEPGESSFAQIHLEAQAILQHNDRFILRNSSGEITLGGGEIIDAFPLHHRRRPKKLIADLNRIAEGKLPELIAATVKKLHRVTDQKEIAGMLNVSVTEIAETLATEIPEELLSYEENNSYILITKKENNRIKNNIAKLLKTYHKRNPFNKKGLTAQELIGMLGLQPSTITGVFLNQLLVQLEKEKLIRQLENTWIMADHNVTIGKDVDRQIKVITDYLKKCGMQTPLASELTELTRKNNIQESELKQIMRYLIENKEIYNIEDNYLHASIVDPCRHQLLTYLAENPGGITVAQFRDLISGNRKICLLLIARFDSEGITSRQGDIRTITRKGLDLLTT